MSRQIVLDIIQERFPTLLDLAQERIATISDPAILRGLNLKIALAPSHEEAVRLLASDL